MPGNFIKSGQTRPKLVNGDQEQLTKVVKCRSQESHDSFQAITSVISGETDKMKVEHGTAKC